MVKQRCRHWLSVAVVWCRARVVWFNFKQVAALRSRKSSRVAHNYVVRQYTDGVRLSLSLGWALSRNAFRAIGYRVLFVQKAGTAVRRWYWCIEYVRTCTQDLGEWFFFLDI